MWKDSNRNIVVIFQPNILRIVGFYVRHSAFVMLVAFLVALARGLRLNFFGLVYTSLVRVYTRVFLSFGASVHLTSLISNPNDFPRVLITLNMELLTS